MGRGKLLKIVQNLLYIMYVWIMESWMTSVAEIENGSGFLTVPKKFKKAVPKKILRSGEKLNGPSTKNNSVYCLFRFTRSAWSFALKRTPSFLYAIATQSHGNGSCTIHAVRSAVRVEINSTRLRIHGHTLDLPCRFCNYIILEISVLEMRFWKCRFRKLY